MTNATSSRYNRHNDIFGNINYIHKEAREKFPYQVSQIIVITIRGKLKVKLIHSGANMSDILYANKQLDFRIDRQQF